MSIWFFHGKDEFRISREISSLRDKLTDSAFRAMNFRIFYSPDFEELLEICAMAPLMFGNMISVIHCEKYFLKTKNKKIDFSDEQLKSLEFAFKNNSESNNLIFVCNIPANEDKKIDTRTKIFKLLASCSNMKDFPVYKSYEEGFKKFLNELIKEKNLSMTAETSAYLAEYLGTNFRLIDSELEKLKTAVYPETKVSKKDIDKYCTLSDNFLALADLIIEKSKDTVMKNLKAVLEKKHSLEVIALLHTSLRRLVYIKTFTKEKSVSAMAEELKIKEYPVKLLLEKVKNISLDNLLYLKHRLTEVEMQIKTGTVYSPEFALEGVFLEGV